MADLLTHLTAARIPSAFLSNRRLAALLIIGTFLPDLASKGLFWIAGTPPDRLTPTHSILGVLLLSYAASLFIEPRLRSGAFGALGAGALLHVAVDLAKDNMGLGASALFDPFLGTSFELGWINPENVVWLMPVDLAVLGLVWLWERSARRVRE